MKTNKVLENMYIPKKIYLPYKDGKVIGLVKESGIPYKSGVDGNIEYTRTDAFMKKAKEGFCKAMCQGKPPRSTCTSLGTCKEYDNFVNYMKGQ